MKKVRFVINPISGVAKNNELPELIEKYLRKDLYSFDIVYTDYRGHATQIAQEAVLDCIDILVIVGGDGSIREASAPLLESTVTLGIIPCGSGNGIARHFRIPLHLKQAIQHINKGTTLPIDTATLNDRSFTGFCGFGYDALIAHRFDTLNKRGFWSYVKLVLRELRNFEPIEVECLDSGKKWTNLFFCSIANTSQFGNNFRMSPGSDPTDGKLELILVKKGSIFNFAKLIYKSYFGDVLTSAHVETISSHRFHLRIGAKLAHVDGDPFVLSTNTIQITCKPKSLSIIA